MRGVEGGVVAARSVYYPTHDLHSPREFCVPPPERCRHIGVTCSGGNRTAFDVTTADGHPALLGLLFLTETFAGATAARSRKLQKNTYRQRDNFVIFAARSLTTR